MTNSRANFNLLTTGIFTLPEAARLVGADQNSVRVWVDGHKNKQEAVIENDLGKVNGKTAISFHNLIELRFVAFFAGHGVGLKNIRKIMGEVRERLAHPHPFATKTVFRTDGKKIVEEIAFKNGGSAIYDLKSKNFEMPDVVFASLANDIVYDPDGEAVAWRPRPEIAPNVIVHPKFSFGRPILQDSRIPTRTLADAVRVEKSTKFVAEIYEVAERRVKEALAFENSFSQAA